eukprot:2689772-Alexandrium_andersonii.AAC.1
MTTKRTREENTDRESRTCKHVQSRKRDRAKVTTSRSRGIPKTQKCGIAEWRKYGTTEAQH